ncbi:acetylxylan esterase [Prevotella sp. KH2C16]|uniref:acetylxylan esterase n=1 Tax=Prevotella sp. KH2C16 TaxID=1855325 RepID=UPI0008E64A4B|nr:acetylxylan esterase [Prevotella sp. KH2C16]SFG33563.1 Cephalosporin-C deacetylase [Prevotella sp. KH2C16]
MRKYLLLLVTLFALTPASAQIRGNNITVTIQPDHKDWNYKVGEKAVFTVNVLRSGTLLDNVRVDYEAGPAMYPDIQKRDVTLKDGTMKFSGKMSKPGFYQLKVTAHVGDKDYEGLCMAGFSPEKIQPATQCPADFDAFWSKALDDARKFDLDPHLTPLPDRSTKDVAVYEVSFVNDRPNGRIYGILCIPKKAGRYPALLRVPGAGIRQYHGDVWTAAQGAITLEIGIHGIPVTMEQSVYDEMFTAGLDGYYDVNLENPDRNYYKRVVVGAVRAVDYLASLPEWNGASLGVSGSSQGGFLSLAVAALDQRVTFCGVVHGAMCDYESELKGVAGGWPHYFYRVKNPSSERIRGARYYDGVNFARRIKCPGWFSFGYNDEVVPPTSAYGTYNVFKAPKTLSLYQLTGHYWYQEQWDEWQNWLLEQMKIK